MSDKPTITGMDHLVLTVTDIAATIAFYSDVLGMASEVFQPSDGSTRHALRFGVQKINLHAAATPFVPHAAHPAPGSADLCFLSEQPLADWLRHLARRNVVVEDGPARRTGATGPILSLYFRDPDGNLIEVSNKG